MTNRSHQSPPSWLSDPQHSATLATTANATSSMQETRAYIEYSSNNSGGRWWLSDDDWKALEDAGWIVHWVHELIEPHGDLVHPEPEYSIGEHHHGYTDPLMPAAPSGQRWLGALAKSAAKVTDDPKAAVDEWERLTNQSASDEGCNCCGEPHYFTFHDAKGKTRSTSVEVVRTRLNWS